VDFLQAHHAFELLGVIGVCFRGERGVSRELVESCIRRWVNISIRSSRQGDRSQILTLFVPKAEDRRDEDGVEDSEAQCCEVVEGPSFALGEPSGDERDCEGSDT
jgi:hypothetical protein